MIVFVVRKTVYDLWDNFLRIALTNLGAIVLVVGAALLVGIAPGSVLTLAALAAGSLLCVLYFIAAAKSAAKISDYGYYGFKQFALNLKASLRGGGLLCWGLLFAGAVLTTVVMPFYLRRPGLPWLMLAILLFYVLVSLALIILYFTSGLTRLEGSVPKRLQRTAAFVLNNMGFCLATVALALIGLLLSVFFAFLWPGPVGALLFFDEALRLRLLKYDWLIANPDPLTPDQKRKIPWDDLLKEEKENTGERTLRNLIFPWKE